VRAAVLVGDAGASAVFESLLELRERIDETPLG
jgi:hypothetical protein